MSVSHVSLPPLSHLDLAAHGAQRYPPYARWARDGPLIRLPSYKELTSQCDDSSPRPAIGRSSLFTAGLIHLPPLKVPDSPSTSGGSKRPPQPRSISPQRTTPESEDDWKAGMKHRFLDLEEHCPIILAPRVNSPYNESLHSGGSSNSDGPQRGPALSQSPRDGRMPQNWPHTHTSIALSPYDPAYDGHQQPHQRKPHGHAHQPYAQQSSNLNQGQPKLKFSHAKAGGRAKKQALSCFFCRERKIACGRPEEGITDPACNQCARRKIPCAYPTVSHRGQHSRIKSAARKAHSVQFDGGGIAS